MKRGRAGKVIAILKGGTTRFGVVLTQELEVSAILYRRAKSFRPLKGRGRKRFYPVLRGGRKTFWAFFLFCSPPPPRN